MGASLDVKVVMWSIYSCRVNMGLLLLHFGKIEWRIGFAMC